MQIRALLCLFLWSAAFLPMIAQPSLGVFNITTDTSLVVFEEEDQIYSLTCVADGNYPTIVARDLEGDFLLTGTFGSVNEFANWEGIGWMVQTPSGYYASLLNSQFYVYVTRQARRKGSILARNNVRKFELMQIERQQDVLTVRAATAGGDFEEICQLDSLDLPSRVRAGIFLGGEKLVTAGIWNVRLEQPPTEHVYSTLETVDVLTGIRKVLHKSPEIIDKAQWMAGGERLLFKAGPEWQVLDLQEENSTPQTMDGGKLPGYRKSGRDEELVATTDGVKVYYSRLVDGERKIWRKNEDGSNPVQITTDGYHDFFPRVSPDGFWLAMLSYPPEVDPEHLPKYERAMVRVVPVDGAGNPSAIAHLFAGEGSMNVPCWSYDSESLTFVSYSGR
ncbi:MAG: hypothetical protein AAGA85_08055 [Bacteroidota bacterium]